METKLNKNKMEREYVRDVDLIMVSKLVRMVRGGSLFSLEG